MDCPSANYGIVVALFAEPGIFHLTSNSICCMKVQWNMPLIFDYRRRLFYNHWLIALVLQVKGGVSPQSLVIGNSLSIGSVWLQNDVKELKEINN